jgi:hypothetical protein
VSKEQFEALLSAKGIGNDDTVVLYGGNNNWFASYAYWYFKLYGHGDARLLDGGRKKWELDSRELVEPIDERPATTYTAKDQDRSIRAFRDEVEAPSARRTWSTSAAPTSTPASCSPRAPAAGAVAAARPHPDGREHPVVAGGQRRRHLQERRRAHRAVRRQGRRPRQGHHRLLPHR